MPSQAKKVLFLLRVEDWRAKARFMSLRLGIANSRERVEARLDQGLLIFNRYLNWSINTCGNTLTLKSNASTETLASYARSCA